MYHKQSILDHLKQALSRVDLLRYMVAARLKLSKKDLILGYFWWFLDPLLLAAMYWFIISVVFKRGGEEFAFYLIIGLLPFRAFSGALGQAASSIISNRSLISQVSFPRIFLPVADIIANHIKLLGGMVIVLAVGALYGRSFSYSPLILLPVVLQFLIAVGIGLILATSTVFVPDVRNMLRFMMRIWFYGTPILYSLQDVPKQFHYLLFMNPMTPVIELYRDLLFYERLPNFNMISLAVAYSLLFLIIGIWLYIRYDSIILKRL